MERFKIAELVVEMAPEHEPLYSRSRNYLYDGDEPSVYDVGMRDQVYQTSRERYPSADDPLLEYMMTGTMFYTGLIEKGGLLLHASAVELDSKAYLFSAPSGTGKSTHTSLWLKEFEPRARILNDDKPAIRCFDNGIFVYGTPWSGKTDLSINIKVPLQGICFIKRGKTNQIERMSSSKAIPAILDQTVRPSDPKLAEMLLDHIDRIVREIPIYSLECNMDPQAAHISYQAMSKGDSRED